MKLPQPCFNRFKRSLQQEKVLAFVQHLKSNSLVIGVPGSELVKRSKDWDQQAFAEIEAALANEPREIDWDGWQ